MVLQNFFIGTFVRLLQKLVESIVDSPSRFVLGLLLDIFQNYLQKNGGWGASFQKAGGTMQLSRFQLDSDDSIQFMAITKNSDTSALCYGPPPPPGPPGPPPPDDCCGCGPGGCCGSCGPVTKCDVANKVYNNVISPMYSSGFLSDPNLPIDAGIKMVLKHIELYLRLISI
ncbi:hypothetical protein HUJ04_005061 [Dendroctonus ponderosae]|nr:hypothetical protein HUJ04_005061 [Dendroctonus ponderosae]